MYSKEQRREYARQWSSKNREKIRQYYKNQWANMSIDDKKKKSEYAKKQHLKRKYGITQEQWNEMYEKQGGVCALCKIPGRVGKHGKLAVDHCHETGRIRGLLCASCNVSIANLGDNIVGLMNALNYVLGPKQ